MITGSPYSQAQVDEMLRQEMKSPLILTEIICQRSRPNNIEIVALLWRAKSEPAYGQGVIIATADESKYAEVVNRVYRMRAETKRLAKMPREEREDFLAEELSEMIRMGWGTTERWMLPANWREVRGPDRDEEQRLEVTLKIREGQRICREKRKRFQRNNNGWGDHNRKTRNA